MADADLTYPADDFEPIETPGTTSQRCQTALGMSRTGLLAQPCAGPLPDWAGLPSELWQAILERGPRAELESVGKLPCSDALQRMEEGWVRGCCLLVAAATTCKSLRSALVGPQGMQLSKVAYLHSSYASLAPQPADPLDQTAAALGPASAHAGLDMAQRSRGLNCFVARKAGCLQSALVRGGGWALPELQDALAAFKELTSLALVDMDSSTEAVIMSAALAHCAVTRLKYIGSQPFAFPGSVRKLCLECVTGSEAECRALFACLTPLKKLRTLQLALSTMEMATPEFERLADWLPQLQHLDLVVHIPASVGTHNLAGLSKLRPGVLIRVALFVYSASTIVSGSTHSQSLTCILEQLQSVPLYSLLLDCCDA